MFFLNIVILGVSEQYIHWVSSDLFERYQKNKLYFLDMVCFGENYCYAKVTLSIFITKFFATVSNLEDCRVTFIAQTASID